MGNFVQCRGTRFGPGLCTCQSSLPLPLLTLRAVSVILCTPPTVRCLESGMPKMPHWIFFHSTHQSIQSWVSGYLVCGFYSQGQQVTDLRGESICRQLHSKTLVNYVIGEKKSDSFYSWEANKSTGSDKYDVKMWSESYQRRSHKTLLVLMTSPRSTLVYPSKTLTKSQGVPMSKNKLL